MGIASRPSPPLLAAFGLGLATAALLTVSPASAYCRSTTCRGDDCPRDENGCKTTGAKLAWASHCVGISIQKDGTVNLPMSKVKPALEAAFATWNAVTCDGAPLSMKITELAEVSCHEAQYNPDGPNANIVMFQDNRWNYHGPDDTLAKTTVTYDMDTGEIFDADIEINYAYNEFTVGDQDVVYDLQSIVTHETGHFLGLDHSLDPEATMNAGYDPGTTDLRTLADDDIAAICAVYPPGRKASCDPTPRNGLGDVCAAAATKSGCSVSPGGSSAGGLVALLGGVGLIAAAARRRAS